MKKNMGKNDRVVRAIAAVVLIALGFVMGPWISYLLFVLAGVMAVTSAVGVCPLYNPLGIDTLGRPKKAKKK